MTGIIKSYVESKGYGFIKGDNGIDYFFHYSSLKHKEELSNSADDGKYVEFDEKPTPKGYNAINIVLLQAKTECLYEYPPSVFFSKNKHVNGWEIIESSGWYAEESSTDSPEDAKQDMLYRAKQVGANAVVNAHYFKTTGQQGNYKYTIHNYKGQLVRIARRTSGQGIQKENMLGLNSDIGSFIRNQIAQAEKINAHQKKISNKKSAVLIAISIVVYFLPLLSKTTFSFPTTTISIIIALVGFWTYLTCPRMKKEVYWLHKGI